MTQPSDLTATELADRIRAKQVSAVEALEAYLARIDRYNPDLNAVVSLDTERARALAAQADAALAGGEEVGPLHGVPMTLKDTHDVAGLRTTVGTPVLDRLPERDGTVAARLRAAGAIVIAHTNVPPWLGDYQSANPIFGRTNNPWDLGRTPGGSSGGAAAALATKLTPLEIGTDLAGSIRLPAHFCGVYGLKTTEHLVPATGNLRPPDGGTRPVRIMATSGPMARDLDDLELALGLIAGPDGVDGDVHPIPLGTRPRVRLADLRIAVAPSLPGTPLSASVRAQVERVAAAVSDAGAKVVEELPDLDWAAQLELYGKLLFTITGAFDPSSDLPEEQRTLAWYLTALGQRDKVMAAWHRYFADVDALLVPAGMTTAFRHPDDGPLVDVDGEQINYEQEGFPLIWGNLAGLPGLVVPAGTDDSGLPVGVQLVGPKWSELRLLAIAAELEAAGILPGFQTPPGY
jgi:amidase